jgi:anti-sigma B factor antagonist
VTRFSVQSDETEGTAVVTVSGEVDIATAAAITEAIDEHRAAGRPVLMDLSRVVFMDSTGVRTLIAAAKQSQGQPGQFAIRSSLAPPVQRGLQMMGVLELLPLVDA